MNNSIALVESEVRELVRRRGIDPAHDTTTMSELVTEAIADYDDRSARGLVPPLPNSDTAAKIIHDAVAGLGPLQDLLDDDEVEEVWINEPGAVFAARDGKAELTTIILTDRQVRDLVERMLRASGRRLDLSMPFVDAALTTGERLHVAIPDVTRQAWSVNIRKYVVRARKLSDLVARDSLTPHASAFLHAAVVSGLNILVSGATHVGKTTMLGALCGSVPATQRIITLEEVFELNLRHRDVVALQTRAPNLEGVGEITLRRLVKESLRMRPDRIVVGEVREAEAFDLLVSLNAGVPGMCTIHANSARDAVTKMCTLPLLAGENVTAGFTIPTVAAAVDLVVHLDLTVTGQRAIREIVAVPGRVESGVVETADLFRRDETGLRRTGTIGWEDPRFERHGFDLHALLEDPHG